MVARKELGKDVIVLPIEKASGETAGVGVPTVIG